MRFGGGGAGAALQSSRRAEAASCSAGVCLTIVGWGVSSPNGESVVVVREGAWGDAGGRGPWRALRRGSFFGGGLTSLSSSSSSSFLRRFFAPPAKLVGAAAAWWSSQAWKLSAGSLMVSSSPGSLIRNSTGGICTMPPWSNSSSIQVRMVSRRKSMGLSWAAKCVSIWSAWAGLTALAKERGRVFSERPTLGCTAMAARAAAWSPPFWRRAAWYRSSRPLAGRLSCTTKVLSGRHSLMRTSCCRRWRM